MQNIETAKEIDFAELEKSRSFRIFRQAIKSDKTFYSHRYALREFLKYAYLSSFGEITTRWNQIGFKGFWKTGYYGSTVKGIKGATIRVKLAPVELFLDMNRVTDFKRIRKIIPRDDGVLGGSEPFTTAEIKRMLESIKKLRTKAFVHFLASTRIRHDAIIDPILRRKHIAEMPRMFGILTCRNDEYY